jgi:branched-chain amino acid transport system permease protein
MAVGGYGTARLTTALGLGPWLGILIPMIAAAVLAVVIGLPLLRLRGHYLAMATFALALGTNSLAIGAVELTGGSSGISAIPPLSIGSAVLGTPADFLVISWVALALALATYLVLSRSHLGRAWRALATGPDVAASLGVRVRRLKVVAFAVAAVMGAVAGSLYAQFSSFIAPDFINLTMIINLFLIVFVGGRGSLAGPVLGSAVVVLVPQMLSDLGGWQNVAFYVLLLLFMIFLPSGILRTERAQLLALLPTKWRRVRVQEVEQA